MSATNTGHDDSPAAAEKPKRPPWWQYLPPIATPVQTNALILAGLAIGGFLVFVGMPEEGKEMPGEAWAVAGGVFVKLMDGVVAMIGSRKRPPDTGQEDAS